MGIALSGTSDLNRVAWADLCRGRLETLPEGTTTDDVSYASAPAVEIYERSGGIHGRGNCCLRG